MAARSAAAIDVPTVAVVEPLADDEATNLTTATCWNGCRKSRSSFFFDDDGKIDIEDVLVPDD